MEKNLHTAVYRRLMTSADLRDVLPEDPDTGQKEPPKVYYRVAPRDTAPPYICYAARLSDADHESSFIKEGTLTLDIWTFDMDSNLAYDIAKVILHLFNRRVVPAIGITGLRFYHKSTLELSVENNRSNRRSEDERWHRREVTFIVRGMDDEECQTYLNDEAQSLWTS